MLLRISTLVLALLAAPFARAGELLPIAELRAQIEAMAGADKDKVRYYRMVFWMAFDERTLVLWLGREEPYFVDLRGHCVNLTREHSIALSNYIRPGRNHLRTRWDAIYVRDRSCSIARIRPIDWHALRQIDMDLPAMRAYRRAHEENRDATSDR